MNIVGTTTVPRPAFPTTDTTATTAVTRPRQSGLVDAITRPERLVALEMLGLDNMHACYMLNGLQGLMTFVPASPLLPQLEAQYPNPVDRVYLDFDEARDLALKKEDARCLLIFDDDMQAPEVVFVR